MPGGLTLAELNQSAEVLADSEIVGIEISEFESEPDSDDAEESAAKLLDALEPILQRIGHGTADGQNAQLEVRPTKDEICSTSARSGQQ